MEKHLILLVLSFIFLTQLASATIFVPINTQVDIRHSVRVNDAPTTSALCNITVYNPNDFVLVQFKAMSLDNITNTYNYTLPSTNTSITGTYCYDITCLDSVSTFNKTQSYCDIQVNNSGKDYTIPQSVTYFFLFVLSMGLFGIALYGSMKFPYRNETMQNEETGEFHIYRINYSKYLKLLCIVLAYMFLLMIVAMAWNISDGVLEFLTIGVIFRYTFYILLVLIVPSILIVITIALLNLAEDRKIKKNILEGFEGRWP